MISILCSSIQYQVQTYTIRTTKLYEYLYLICFEITYIKILCFMSNVASKSPLLELLSYIRLFFIFSDKRIMYVLTKIKFKEM